ncbi:hypothetical protein [Prosthecobacter sp.]|uniref:hypothetical protein n=1 Tax=Prosthecobacter sp. TaxID=1965333 RepID=UPI002ABBED2F|nr:hypothetical protein [Prosthecobacter sp.]MDZ4404891.1 hypothetical protein [Prosthecobacter sp.]
MAVLHSHKITFFIAQARLLHGTLYDYSRAEYKGAVKKLCIVCPQHGEFWQRPHNHLRGEGCPTCGKAKHSESTRRGAGIDFPAKARDIHGERYDYSHVHYLGNAVEVAILCPLHGMFHLTPQRHLRGTCCPKCGRAKHGRP